MLPSTVRFDQINANYDDNNKLKPKNPENRLYIDRFSEIHAICVKAQVIDYLADAGMIKTTNQTFKINRSIHA